MNLGKDEIRELRRERRQEERKAEEDRKSKSGRNRKIFYGIFIILVIGAIGIGYAGLQPRYPVTGNHIGSTIDGGSFALGDANAPVTIIEYSDFQCPFCAKFAITTGKQIESEYINSGKVKFVYKQFPLVQIHQFAQKAAEASLCAGDQGKFWEYHDTLFANQQAIDMNSLKTYASGLGLDAGQFNSCLDSGAKAADVQKDLAEGRGLGVSSTPTFFINGQQLNGALPFSDFQRIIESELAKAAG